MRPILSNICRGRVRQVRLHAGQKKMESGGPAHNKISLATTISFFEMYPISLLSNQCGSLYSWPHSR